MIRIDPHVFYANADLERKFRRLGIKWQHFRSIIQPRRISNKGYWGGDLIRAMESCPETKEREYRRDKEKAAPAPVVKRSGGHRRDPMLQAILERNGVK